MPRDILHAACEVKRKSQSWVQLFGTPWTIQSMEFSRPEYWSGYPSLLQGIFQTQGSNPGLPHCRQILYQLSYKGSPRILEWVAYPFSSGSSRPRDRTGVSCIAGAFFTNWAMREAHTVLLKIESWDFPGWHVVGTSYFYCKGQGFDLWLRN